MNRFRLPLLIGLAALLCAPALAQEQRVAPTGSADLPVFGPEAVTKVSPEAIRVVSPELIDYDELTWHDQRGVAVDSISYFDTTGTTFFTTVVADPEAVSDTSGFPENLELSELFTPGFGNTPIFGGFGTRGGSAMSAGQVTSFGFYLNAPTGTAGTGDLLIIFSKFESGEPGDLAYARPSADLVLSLDLAALATGGAFEVDVSEFNLFFEDDEEFIWAMQVDSEDGDAKAFPLLDDGVANIGPLAEPSYYDPTRSGGIAFFPTLFLPPGFDPGLYFFSFTDSNNYWFYSKYFDGQQPLVDTEINAGCGDTSAECMVPSAGGTISYTACGQNNGPTQQYTFTIVANGPEGVPDDFPLFSQTVTIPSGAGGCVFRSERVPGTAPDGFYQIRIDVSAAGTTNPLGFEDYDQFFFEKGDPDPAARTAASMVAVSESAPAASFAWEPGTTVREWDFSSNLTAGTAAATVTGAYPNPFSGETAVRFAVEQATDVNITVYDVMGRAVAVLVDGTVEAGQHEAVFNGSELASGVYVYRLEAGAEVQTGRLTLVK